MNKYISLFLGAAVSNVVYNALALYVVAPTPTDVIPDVPMSWEWISSLLLAAFTAAIIFASATRLRAELQSSTLVLAVIAFVIQTIANAVLLLSIMNTPFQKVLSHVLGLGFVSYILILCILSITIPFVIQKLIRKQIGKDM